MVTSDCAFPTYVTFIRIPTLTLINLISIEVHALTVGLKCSEEGGEQRAADADVHQLRQSVQAQLRREVIEERVRVLALVLLHQLDQVLHRGHTQRERDTRSSQRVT